jgi:hypothetical protein
MPSNPKLLRIEIAPLFFPDPPPELELPVDPVATEGQTVPFLASAEAGIRTYAYYRQTSATRIYSTP